MDEALSRDIEFTVGSYTHTPQRGHPGFFGTFTKTANESHDPNDRRMGGKFLRHANVTRANVFVIGVQTWVDRSMVAENARVKGPPNDYIRIKPSSLRRLAAVCKEMPMPSRLPPSYVQVDDDETSIREQERHVADDPLAPIPEGFEEKAWSESSAMVVKHFMIFTRLSGGEKGWHQAEVTKMLKPKQRSGYTHDAKFADGVRGVRLTADAYNDGCWIFIAMVDPSCDTTTTTTASNGGNAAVLPDTAQGYRPPALPDTAGVPVTTSTHNTTIRAHNTAVRATKQKSAKASTATQCTRTRACTRTSATAATPSIVVPQEASKRQRK
jgi:hypothetical protein